MPQKFPEKYLLAVEQAAKEKPQGGLNGFEQEWNLLDEDLRPLLTVGFFKRLMEGLITLKGRVYEKYTIR